MRFISLLLLICCINLTLCAQQNRFTIGPAIGVDQLFSPDYPLTGPAIIFPTSIRYKAGFLFGVDGSYQVSRFLINARLLTTKRIYQVITQYQYGSGPTTTGAVVVGAHYLFAPLTISYLIKSGKRLQLFAGGGIAPEWIIGSFDRKSFDIYGSGRFTILDPEKPTKPFSVGSCLQLTGRYDLKSRFVLQVQPAFYYFSKVETPFATTNNSSFRVSASVCYKLNND